MLRSSIFAFFSPPASPVAPPASRPATSNTNYTDSRSPTAAGPNIALFTHQDGKNFEVSIVRLTPTEPDPADHPELFEDSDWDSDDWDEDAEDWDEQAATPVPAPPPPPSSSTPPPSPPRHHHHHHHHHHQDHEHPHPTSLATADLLWWSAGDARLVFEDDDWRRDARRVPQDWDGDAADLDQDEEEEELPARAAVAEGPRPEGWVRRHGGDADVWRTRLGED